jgi:hypothetical protein
LLNPKLFLEIVWFTKYLNLKILIKNLSYLNIFSFLLNGHIILSDWRGNLKWIMVKN